MRSSGKRSYYTFKIVPKSSKIYIKLQLECIPDVTPNNALIHSKN